MNEEEEDIVTDVDAWCECDESPTTLERVGGNTYECPDCERWFLVEAHVEEVPANV
jgi:hypothetical protein